MGALITPRPVTNAPVIASRGTASRDTASRGTASRDTAKPATGEPAGTVPSRVPTEGGWYRRTWASPELVEAHGGQRPVMTSILYLLRPGEVSRWHR
ncbi:cupin domain-containing protein, partial [Frankia tisae]|uniref:cupin domain-containing protein n=1 Tax=Frankia tisae TaxID=2950104 RepID=UPI0021C19DD1